MTKQTKLPLFDVIGVPPSVSSELYRERPTLFVDAHAPLELQQYHSHHWHDAPARVIQENLINWLQHQVAHIRQCHVADMYRVP